MRIACLAPLASVLLLAAPAAPASQPPGEGRNQAPNAQREQDAAFSQRALAKLEQAIVSKSHEPAETVFKNIQMFKGVPARRVLRSMDDFTHALGVSCRKCHDVENWASDAKNEKKVARGMLQMLRDINEKYLKPMPGLEGTKAVVSCATCHRGELKPALDAPAPSYPIGPDGMPIRNLPNRPDAVPSETAPPPPAEG